MEERVEEERVEEERAEAERAEEERAEAERAAGADWVADVGAAAGTLLLFDSASVPHAVLPTRRDRLALVGWFCEAGDAQ